MALEDYLEPEVGVAVALTAAVASPRVRKVLRRGAVYGLAGVLMAGDAVSSLARGVARGAKEAADHGQDRDSANAETPQEAAADETTTEEAAHRASPRSRKSAEASTHETE